MKASRFALLLPLAFASTALADVSVKELSDRVRVEIDGQLFTELRYTGAPHVYYWPLIGPGGVKTTRSWPMEDVPGEEHDHPHHRSLWFSHGLVNGVDFWAEGASIPAGKQHKFPIGTIEHDKIIEAKGGAESGLITTSQKWKAADGTIPLTSVQTLKVYDTKPEERVFDFTITLKAGEKDVVMGDTKEGTFGIRIAESMRLKASKAVKDPVAGTIINNEGAKGADVWGKRATWVDMTGQVEGKTIGFTIFDHPSNLRHPTRWHARDYGLFAVNPFCEGEMDKSKPKDSGNYTIAAGKSLTLRYRVLIHQGEPDAAALQGRFAEFAKTKE